jgi:hypothetical protein
VLGLAGQHRTTELRAHFTSFGLLRLPSSRLAG